MKKWGRFRKKAQAVVDFETYGWLIIVLIVVVLVAAIAIMTPVGRSLIEKAINLFKF